MAGDYRDRFAAQARRWQAQDGLDDRTRANVDAFAANVDEHLVVLDAILALMDEVAPYTIEAIMARSDLELGLEALLGRPNPRPERLGPRCRWCGVERSVMEESTAGATAPRPHEEHLPYAVAVVEEFAAAGVAMVEFWADNDEPRDAATELVETLGTDTQLFVGWTEGDDGWHAVPYAGDDRQGYTVYSLAVAPLAPAWAWYLAGVGEAARLCLPGPARSARPG